MKRTYEAMLLLDNREVRKGWQALKEEVNAVFAKHGATVKSSRRWDERRLAYPIARQLRGTYLLNYIEADTQALVGIRRDLEYADPVLRYLMFACEDIPEEAFSPEEAFDETQVRVETEDMPRAAEESESSEDEDGKDDGKSKDDGKAKGKGKGDGEASSEGSGDAEASDESTDAGDADQGDDEEKKDD